MYDKELVRHVIEQILQSSKTITARFKPVRTVNDFTDSPDGMEKLQVAN